MTRFFVTCALIFSGFAGVSWELLWQLKSSLAIGASAQAIAIVIASTMGGMTLGAILVGGMLKRSLRTANPYIVYATLEVIIALFGCLFSAEFRLVTEIDREIFRLVGQATWIAHSFHLLMIVVVLGPPAAAMGATIPILCSLSKSSGIRIGALYGINTLGAALGILTTAFLILPWLGHNGSTIFLVVCNIVAAVFLVSARSALIKVSVQQTAPILLVGTVKISDSFYVFTSGFTIFVLEVCFFRIMRSAFLSTAHSFAIMLSTVLIALFVGSYISESIRKSGFSEHILSGTAGFLVLLVTPILLRLDIFSSISVINAHFGKFLLALAVVGPTVTIIGVIFPLILGKYDHIAEWTKLQVINTIGAVLGALVGTWVFLPLFGVAYTVIGIGVFLVIVGARFVSTPRFRITLCLSSVFALVLAFFGQEGLGTKRIVGMRGATDYSVVTYKEESDFSVAVIDQSGLRSLYIDGFSASSATNLKGYMAWMGRLPMLMNADPKSALVICFGTGETVNALRHENPKRVSVVDISNAVFDMAPYFPTNEGVLSDPRVNRIVMDGRAWLKRTDARYDVITLEPMPPTFAGSNSLYSVEFYRLARERLVSGGTIAQWLPMHLVTSEQAESIARTFSEVFPDSLLWIYPPYRTAILVGKKGGLGADPWPGISRIAVGRELEERIIRSSVQLSGENLRRYARSGTIITDDNQYLSYGWSAQQVDFNDSPEARGYRWENETIARVEQAKSAEF